MRIDKFLKVARVIKRRVLAKEAIERNRVYINDKLAKPSHEVQEGDVIEVKMHHYYVKFIINRIALFHSKQESEPMITMLEEHDETIDA